MATAKSTRSKRARSRLTASCPPAFRQSQPGDGGSSFMPSSALDTEPSRQISLVISRLRAIYGTAVTAEFALRQQAAEQDPEIADCLRAGVCDPIADQIQALEEVVGDSPEKSERES
jgi:hypothetical protein